MHVCFNSLSPLLLGPRSHLGNGTLVGSSSFIKISHHAQGQSSRQSILNSVKLTTLTITILSPHPPPPVSPSPISAFLLLLPPPPAPQCTVYSSFFPLPPSSLPGPRWLWRPCSTARVKIKVILLSRALSQLWNPLPVIHHIDQFTQNQEWGDIGWSIYTVLEINIKCSAGEKEAYSLQLTSHTEDENTETNNDTTVDSWLVGTL